MKNDAKIEEKLTCQFKIDMRDLTNFDLRTRILKNLHLSDLLLTKVYNARAKKSIVELCLIALKIDAKF